MNADNLLERQKELADKLARLLENFKKDGPTRKTHEYLNKKQDDVEAIWKNFDDLHEQIKLILKEDHPYFTEDLYGKTGKIYDTVSQLIEKTRNKAQTTKTPTTTTLLLPSTSPSFNNNESRATGANVQTNSWETAPLSYLEANKLNNLPKLPPVKIPKFNGDYKEWKPFIEIFTNVIHCNPYLSNVEKMQYLLYHLEGDARKVVSHLQLCGDNYNTAIQLVQSRFNNNRKIITTYINTIMDAKRVEHRSQEDVIMLYDTIRECLEALKNFNCRTEEWGPIIVCIAMRKLDPENLRLFEESLSNPREMPSTNELLNFLEKRYQVLDCIRSSKQVKPNVHTTSNKRAFHTTVKRCCAFCNQEHSIYQCIDFKKMSVEERNAFISQKNLCTNCMAHKKTEKCKTNKSCFYCKRKHHTLLHKNKEVSGTHPTNKINVTRQLHTNEAKQTQQMSEDAIALHNNMRLPNVLLPTAIVRIKNAFGQTEQYRALIDPGSQVSLITEETVQNLRLQKERISTTILGVGEAKSAKAYSKVNIHLQLKHKRNTFLSVEALVLPKLNSLLPEVPAPKVDINQYGNILLADPTFNLPGPIDLLLGADVYANIVLDGLKPQQPTAQNTKLGWIIFGSIPNSVQYTNKVSSFVSTTEIDRKMEQFWEINDNVEQSQDEDECAVHFQTTHRRDNDGRYIVRLPFKENLGSLGCSKERALARLLQMEKKLRKSPDEMKEYNKFLTEYLTLGHMSPAKTYTGDEAKVYYLPHHAVFKMESTTTKLRVVFDASCKTSSGLSLNDLLHSGQKLQQDLNQILLRWRKHRYVFTADIEKMFRQIKVAQEDRNYQRILWRQQPNEPIKEYVLNTVTYGTAPATFLAVTTLKQLAKDDGNRFPIAQKVLNNDFYIDDMLSGADTKEEANQLQRQIITLLYAGGFNLRKWTSNNDDLLNSIPEDLLEKGILEIGDDDSIKTLGIHWNPKHDEFQFNLKFEKQDTKFTKRSLLSKIATIFDPLGWLAPVTITTKLIMQSLWKAGTDWDQIPPVEIADSWRKLESEMGSLQSIRVPRWINYRRNQEVQIHGFCDASEKAYAAVVYARTLDSFGKIHTTLLTARTRVAPLKQKITLPRLELCGAVLLAQLIKTTINALEISSPKIFAWCDSEITLAWIAKNPNNWHTFVANRVNEIHSLVGKNIWRHVSSSENPADVASRGISPSKLTNFHLWWRGPLWLSQSSEAWPSNKLNLITNEEEKETAMVFTVTASSKDIFKCSTYTKQVRVISYCLRFIENCKRARTDRKTDHLSTDELQTARNSIIKMVQLEAFSDEINTLKNEKQLKKGNKLLSLHPFIDTDSILRVGGRLEKSNLPMDAKHQVLLPQKHHITNLIIDHAHHQTLHGGTQLTLNYLRANFWIIDGKRVVQGRNHKCIRCVRYRKKITQPLMGDLPAVRITPSPPFSNCGIDYAGPFLTKASKGRGTKTNKGYIALFICMVTKAIHLELVNDLTTDAFLAAYRRFVARRGNCKQIYSDNGTNFVGARNKMDKDLQLAIALSTKQAAETLANDGTEWKFIPVASPHFGGLWEAGVKSVKGHLKRILGETLLTYEEFSTVLCQVEACLNSRPIGQQSNDPRDLEPLTPGHFLIGRPLIAPPVPDIEEKQIHQRWKLVTKLQQDIWKRWSEEYLSLLQQRSKWKTEGKNPSIGELVLIKEDNLPPQKWSLGRIVQLHPGDDGAVRVVSVQHKNCVKKRPLNKICQLPINIHHSEDDNSDFKPVTAMTTLSRTKESIPSRNRRGNLQNKAHLEPELWTKPEHFDRIVTTKATKRPKSTPSPTIKKKRVRVAPCTWASKLLHSTLLIIYWLTVAFAQDYELIQPKLGFYVENLGNAQIKRGNLRLQVTFPREELLNDQKNIDNTWNQIKQMCDKTKKVTQITRCQTLFQHFSTRRQNLLRTVDEVLQIPEHKTRKRRGLLGKLLTSIFGVNDEVYNDIESLQHNQQNLLQLTNQQVLLLNTKINQSNFRVLEKLKQFDTRLSQAISSINEMASWYTSADHNRISIEVIATYLSAEDYYDELQEKYNHWLRAMHNHGHLLDFVNPQDINAAIQNTSQKIGSNFFILRTPQDRLEIRMENNTVNLYGYLNIVERTLYDLIHVTPTPHIIKENKFAVADIKFSTLAVNYNQQNYFSLAEQELKSCTIIAGHVYLCTPTITYSIEESPSCVIDEIYNRHPKTSCEMHQLKVTGTIWKALAMKNTWLYMTDKTRVVAVTCKGARTELLLNTTGIIHLHNDCHIKTKEVTLKTALDESMEVIGSHIKEIPLKAVNFNFDKPPSTLQSGALIQPNEQILDYIVEPEQHPLILRKSLILHSTIMSTIILIFVLSILIWNYWDRLKMIMHRSKRESTRVQGDHSPSAASIQHHFDRVLASGRPPACS